MDGDSTLGDDATVAPALTEDAPGDLWRDEAAAEHPAEPTAEHPAEPTPEASDGPAEELPPATGDPSVDQATAEVAATFGEPLETRLAAYERAHRALQDRLADVEG